MRKLLSFFLFPIYYSGMVPVAQGNSVLNTCNCAYISVVRLPVMSHLCQPYGVLISCTCNGRGQIFQCVPKVGAGPGAELDLPQTEVQWPRPLRNTEEQGDYNLDTERTEIILSATFLLVVILSFVG